MSCKQHSGLALCAHQDNGLEARAVVDEGDPVAEARGSADRQRAMDIEVNEQEHARGVEASARPMCALPWCDTTKLPTRVYGADTISIPVQRMHFGTVQFKLK